MTVTADQELRCALAEVVSTCSPDIDHDAVRRQIDTHRQARAARRQRVRRTIIAGAAAIAVGAGALAAFRFEPTPSQRPGLERYEPAALDAVPGLLPRATDEIVVIMEAHVTCQSMRRYVVGGHPSSTDAVLRQIAQSEDRAPIYRDQQGVQRSTLAEFSRLAEQRVRDSAATASVAPAADFIRSAGCDPSADYDQPILRPGR